MAGDFNLFFNSKLDAAGGNSTLKRKSLAELIELKEAYDLCDVKKCKSKTIHVYSATFFWFYSMQA